MNKNNIENLKQTGFTESNTNVQGKNRRESNVGDSIDLFYDLRFSLLEEELRGKYGNAVVDAYKETEWEPPVSFDKYSVPAFPVNIFKEPLQSMVKNIAESVQTPIDLPGVVAIGILSTCIQQKFEVIPKVGWREQLNLYTVSLLEPSTRKSAVFSAMTKPIRQFEKELQEKMELPIKNRNVERNTLEKRQELLQREYAKDQNPEHLMEIKEINKKLLDLPKLYEPTLLIDDATPEAIVSRIHQNKGKVSILSAEGDLFERFKNKNVDQVKYDVFLKPYSGDPIRTDRMTRETEAIDNPIMTICITAQPSVIKELPSSVHERGLIARFFMSIPVDNLGHRDSRAPEISEEVTHLYESFIRKLLHWETHDTIPLRLSEDALKLLYDTMDEVEIEFRENGIFHNDLKSWAGKLIGQLLRIAGLLHVSYQAITAQNITDVDTTISKETLASALELKEYLILHAEKAFGVMKLKQEYADAEYLLKVILNQYSPIIEKQKIHQNTKKVIRDIERRQRAYDILEYHSYIKQVKGGKSGNKGFFLVNPSEVKDTEHTIKYHNYPSKTQTIENIEKDRGVDETLEFPNAPNNTYVTNFNKNEEKQGSPTTPISPGNPENNNLTNGNYTTSQREYKVVKV
ncbi:YfjI family protein [Lysinibacillus sp. BW-2-10]|uniref:YfjI family protein n=1 Tax=Lysinibacillus sp. BW-2-10 TaxID=2590030 RepID=UPI00117D1470|nr:YfjI family protein [Lysinibacillus sp. BW-2-10]TSI07655.1 DUF3987 domain-containing protein [Lysinibacillus sp. BW-2-10]